MHTKESSQQIFKILNKNLDVGFETDIIFITFSHIIIRSRLGFDLIVISHLIHQYIISFIQCTYYSFMFYITNVNHLEVQNSTFYTSGMEQEVLTLITE